MTVPFELQIIHKQSGVQLFSYRFREDIKLEPTLISGFITAVISFAEELKPSEGKEMIRYIERGDFILQVEPGNLVVGLLILSCKDYSFKEKLKILVFEFENEFYDQIVDWSGVTSIFSEFEEKVKQLISKKPISPYHIPQLVNTDRAPQKLDDMKWAIITRINGLNSINTISEELDLSVDVVQSIISYFEEAGLVKTHFNISDDNVLELTKKGLNSLENNSDDYNELMNIIGEKGLQILSLIKTQISIKQIKTKLTINSEEITNILEKLVSERFLEILPQWRVILDKKAVQFTRSMEFIDDLFQLIFDEADNWMGIRELERVKKNTFALMLIKDEPISKLVNDAPEYLIERNNLKKLFNDLGSIPKVANRLEVFFRTLKTNIEREIGSNLTKDIMGRAHKRLIDQYDDLLTQQVELQSMAGWLKL